ncbi:MAG TPA: 5'/3'-nucleotidase SurE [bacterium]|nr:5'/3'-nucleotidase SurE [bacterium]
MRVLLTNDDGITSPGLAALARAVCRVAETYVVAPEHERSAASHAITLHKPLRATRASIRDVDVTAWATNGTPADCVVLAVLDLMGTPPDIVVSGINVGANLGMDLIYSGTVSGAVEAALFGIPSVAISVGAFREIHWEPAAAFAATLVGELSRRGLPRDTFLNVNVPNLPADELRGVEITRQGTRRYVSRLEKRSDPRGRDYYWLTGSAADEGSAEGTDVRAVAEGRISVTPLRLDMTHDELDAVVRSWNLTVPTT